MPGRLLSPSARMATFHRFSAGTPIACRLAPLPGEMRMPASMHLQTFDQNGNLIGLCHRATAPIPLSPSTAAIITLKIRSSPNQRPSSSPPASAIPSACPYPPCAALFLAQESPGRSGNPALLGASTFSRGPVHQYIAAAIALLLLARPLPPPATRITTPRLAHHRPPSSARSHDPAIPRLPRPPRKNLLPHLPQTVRRRQRRQMPPLRKAAFLPPPTTGTEIFRHSRRLANRSLRTCGNTRPRPMQNRTPSPNAKKTEPTHDDHHPTLLRKIASARGTPPPSPPHPQNQPRPRRPHQKRTPPARPHGTPAHHRRRSTALP